MQGDPAGSLHDGCAYLGHGVFSLSSPAPKGSFVADFTIRRSSGLLDLIWSEG
jgi:hypothetical protein